ncbi:MAG TPA: hypothetical protein VGB98_16020 [Pyrinomonadaceae bacterium]|jgi:hypothetical protein
MDRAFISDLLNYVACFAVVIACIGCVCTTVRYGITGKTPHGEMKMLASLFFISAALCNLAPAIEPPAAPLAGTAGTLSNLPDHLSPYIHALWAFAYLAASIGAMKVIDAFEHPERGWGRGWEHVARAGEKLREYAACKSAEGEQRRTRANWHECMKAGADAGN